MRALSTAIPAARRLLRSDGLQRWFVHEPVAGAASARVIKQLAPSSAADADLAPRWLEAAARNASLTHPGCTQVQEWGVYEGSAYLVSRAPTGVPLRSLLDAVRSSGARLAAQLVAPIGIMILEALDHAPQRDSTLTHLDLDLDGVTVSPDGSVVLSEFALWSVLSPAEIARCRFDSGRVQYCAPELVQSRAGDQRSDIFSVGGLLYHLLTGERPFAGATQLLIALAIASGERALVHERAPEAPEGLCDVIETMLATSADERFQTPAAAATALRWTLGERLVEPRASTPRPHAKELPAASLRPHPEEPRAASLCPHAEEPHAASPEPAPPPLCFPGAASPLPDPLVGASVPELCPAQLVSNPQQPAVHSAPQANIAVNDGRTAYVRVRPPVAPREHVQREPTQPPLLLPSAALAAPRLSSLARGGTARFDEPRREPALSVSFLRSLAEPPPAASSRAPETDVPAAWSAYAKRGERWSDPSETVFQVRLRPAASSARAGSGQPRARERRSAPPGARAKSVSAPPGARAKSRHVRGSTALLMSTVLGLATVLALYLVYRLLS